jgi:DNA polymerase-1
LVTQLELALLYRTESFGGSYATSATKKGGRVVIVSPDKDLLQLVRPGVRVFDPKNKVLFGML